MTGKICRRVLPDLTISHGSCGIPLGKGSKLSNHPFANTFVINSTPRCERPISSVSTSICFFMQFPFKMINVTFHQKKQNKTNNKTKANSSGEQAVLGEGTVLRCKASRLDRNSLRPDMFQFASQGNNPILDTKSQWKKSPTEAGQTKGAQRCKASSDLLYSHLYYLYYSKAFRKMGEFVT